MYAVEFQTQIKNGMIEIPQEYLRYLHDYVKVIVLMEDTSRAEYEETGSGWSLFIKETYGCLADDPIERGEQGSYEIREELE